MARYKALIITAAALLAVILYACPPAEAADMKVKYSRGRISVKANEAPFGEVMDRIARNAGFEVLISPDIAQKTLSTEFSDIDLERGIQRLMGLISHRNFFIFYGRDDNIKKIEVYGAGGRLGTDTGAALPDDRPAVPVMNSSQMPMVMDPPTPSPAKTPATPTTPGRGQEAIKGLPYIPPVAVPEYIPPRRGIGQIRK